MSGSRILGLLLLAPAFVFVVLFFLAPVVLTAVFALTNMSTASSVPHLDIPGDMRRVNSHPTDTACTVFEVGKA